MELFQDIKEFLFECEQLQKPPLIALLGPTASGKTALSIRIAKEFEGEVISADSRQVYKCMDIGTDKIAEASQEGVRHHLIDVIDPTQEFTLADYKRLALMAVNEIHKRKKVPILCGGTGLYINSIIENYQIPRVPPNHELRQELKKYYEEHGAEALHKLLQEKDANAALKIHPNNVRYIVRALEINMAGNQNKIGKKGEKLFKVFSIGIDWDREILYDRINRRVDEQISRGLLNEVKTLLMKGYSESLPSMYSLGYQELIEYLRGDTTIEEAVEKIKKNTRNYAKRQLTWFRRYQDIHWVNGSAAEDYLANK